jgi:hypothetical protein
MHCHFSDHLDNALAEGDLRRKRFQDLKSFEEAWEEERQTILLLGAAGAGAGATGDASEAGELLRDGKCAVVRECHHLGVAFITCVENTYPPPPLFFF